jgi:hypothetical protein
MSTANGRNEFEVLLPQRLGEWFAGSDLSVIEPVVIVDGATVRG